MVVVYAGSPFYLFIQSSPEPKVNKRAYSICRHPSFVREPIVYAGIRRPSVVCQHFQTTSKAVMPILLIFQISAAS